MFHHPPLAAAVITRYLPAESELWLPGMSALLAPGQGTTWTVPADGTYAIYASRRLAAHPWFRQPLYFESPAWRNRDAVAIRPDDAATGIVAFTINGIPAPIAAKTLTLRRHDRLSATTSSTVPVGIMLPSVPRERLFILPPAGVTLEASASPQWHVPDLSVLLYADE
jgi:hypothetical protein